MTQLIIEAQEFLADYNQEMGNWPAHANAKLISRGPALIHALLQEVLILTEQTGVIV